MSSKHEPNRPGIIQLRRSVLRGLELNSGDRGDMIDKAISCYLCIYLFDVKLFETYNDKNHPVPHTEPYGTNPNDRTIEFNLYGFFLNTFVIG